MPPRIFSRNALRLCWGIQTGVHKRGLEPQIFRKKIRQNSFRENRAFLELFRRLSLRTSQPWGGSRNSPKRAFLAQLAPVGLSPRLLSPCLDLPDCALVVLFGAPSHYSEIVLQSPLAKALIVAMEGGIYRMGNGPTLRCLEVRGAQ